jgi:peptidyl-prolyl cis-trans isomerase A (cyclophilin A)
MDRPVNDTRNLSSLRKNETRDRFCSDLLLCDLDPFYMKPIRRAFLLITSVFLLALIAKAQQTPATDTPAGQTTDQPAGQAAEQSLPEAPDTHAHVSPQPTGPTAVFDTSMGRMTCKLFSTEAPNTVSNFVGLAEGTKDWTNPATHEKMHGKSIYNGTTFHRVIPDFMIQGGDPLGNGEGDPGYYINDEFDPNLNFDVAGRLAMANSGPNTDGSQFFITTAPYDSGDQHYTIFGQCDEHSVLIAQSIEDVERDSKDKPLQPVTLNKITIVRQGDPMPPAPMAASAPATPTAQPQQ